VHSVLRAAHLSRARPLLCVARSPCPSPASDAPLPFRLNMAKCAATSFSAFSLENMPAACGTQVRRPPHACRARAVRPSRTQRLCRPPCSTSCGHRASWVRNTSKVISRPCRARLHAGLAEQHTQQSGPNRRAHMPVQPAACFFAHCCAKRKRAEEQTESEAWTACRIAQSSCLVPGNPAEAELSESTLAALASNSQKTSSTKAATVTIVSALARSCWVFAACAQLRL